MTWMQEQPGAAGRHGRLAAGDRPRVNAVISGPLAETLQAGPFAARRTVAAGARGVLLVQSDVPGDFYDICLVYADGRPPQVLVAAQEDAAVVANWRSTALNLGLPLMVRRQDGVTLQPYDHCGSVVMGPFRYRRRTATISRRRPRFLQRRKTTHLPERPVVLRKQEMCDTQS